MKSNGTLIQASDRHQGEQSRQNVWSDPVLAQMPQPGSEDAKSISPDLFTELPRKSHASSSVMMGKGAERYHHCSHTAITWPGVATEEHLGSGQLRQWTCPSLIWISK